MSDADIPIEDKINALKGALRWREEVLMLRAENDRLRKALEPFREWLDKLDAEFPGEHDDTIAGGLKKAPFTFGDLRRARAAWAKEKQ